MHRIAFASVLALAASTARADTRDIGAGVSLSIDSNSLFVVKGTQRALLVGASKFKSFAVDKAKAKVVVDVEDNTCVGHTKHEWTFGHLEARLENWAGYGLYQAKDYKGAIGGFEKAAIRDPGWRIAAYNLASARQLAGDKPAAVLALAPWLAKEPIATYVQVTSDPELAPLLDRPELTAIRAKQAGNAKVTETGFATAYAKERNLIAFARREGSGGSMAYTIDLQIYDAKTGALVASTPLVKWEDANTAKGGLSAAGKKAVAARAAQFQTMLANLGFSEAKVEQGGATEDEKIAKMRVYFPKAKLGIVATPDVSNALRGNTQVGTVKSEGQLREAVYVEDARAVIVKTQRHAIEAGCDAGPEIGIYVMPIK